MTAQSTTAERFSVAKKGHARERINKWCEMVRTFMKLTSTFNFMASAREPGAKAAIFQSQR
tara:strand:+ start:562 stop:744 length:183 start_codon:yes stop_codon:yes gene_type:complete